MINTQSSHEQHYKPLRGRFLDGKIIDILKNAFPMVGEKIQAAVAADIIKATEENAPTKEHVKPGQIVWLAVDVRVRADSPKKNFVPVILTFFSAQDVENLLSRTPKDEVIQDIIARWCLEAFAQGGLMSMRDIAVLLRCSGTTVSDHRIKYEEKYKVVLPSVGSIHDVGTCLTHKKQIVEKYVVQHMDPTTIAKQTNHSIAAVDRYLQEYNRVVTVRKMGKDVDEIHFTTQITKHVIKQYIELYEEFEKHQ